MGPRPARLAPVPRLCLLPSWPAPGLVERKGCSRGASVCRGGLGHSLTAPRSKSPHQAGAGFPLREMGILESALPSSCGVVGGRGERNPRWRRNSEESSKPFRKFYDRARLEASKRVPEEAQAFLHESSLYEISTYFRVPVPSLLAGIVGSLPSPSRANS